MTRNRQESQWVRFEGGDVQGVIDPGLKSLVTPDWLESLRVQVTASGGRVLKDSRVRFAAILPLDIEKALFIKKFRVDGNWEKLKNLIRRSRAKHEWVISRLLTREGVLTPRPLGMIERRNHGILDECYFIAEALEGARDLIDFCERRFRGPEEQKEKIELLRRLARVCRKIHDHGFFHRDLHGGNFLVEPKEAPVLYLVDLHQVRKTFWVSRRRRLWNIAQIFNSIDFVLDRESKKLFLQAYGDEPGSFADRFDVSLETVEAMIRRIVRRRRKSRAKRCLKESTLFTIDRRADHQIFRRREMGLDELMAILRSHRDTVDSQGQNLLKYSPKTIVSILDQEGGVGGRMCVKEYRYPTLLSSLRHLFRASKGKAGWVAGNVLFDRGMSFQRPMAYVEGRRLGWLRAAFSVTETAPDDIEMDRYLVRRFETAPRGNIRQFASAFATWMGSLYAAGIYHQDLKTCNILVREEGGGWGFSLIDLEDAFQGKKIGFEDVVKNLVQINCSVPKSLSYGDRVRFLRKYLAACALAIDERALIRRVLDESRRRGIVYVSPRGVVMESFDEGGDGPFGGHRELEHPGTGSPVS